MDIFVVVMLGVITLVAIIFAIRAKGETGKLTADNAILQASLEQAQEQARSADDDAKRVRELELENTRLKENLAAEKAESAKVNGLSEKIVSLTSENAKLNNKVDNLEENLTAEKAESAKVNGLNEKIMSLNSENAKLNSKVDDLKDRLEERDVLEDRFADSFKALSAETLEQQNKNFMDVADVSLKEREAAIQKLVDPLSKRLGELDQAVANSSGALKQQIETLVETNNKVASETQSLSNALSRPQVRGQWGEMQVERALELSGLQKGIHYATQTPDQQGGRTDFIVYLPNQREIILDSKVSLSAYLEADAASDDSERDQHLQRHARHVKQHADSLAKKEYWNSLPDTADFVVMVVPEFALPPAVERDPRLLDQALSKNVVIVTYSTLVALLKCVAMGWQERNIAAEALKIGELGKDLHDRIVTYTGHVSEVGKALDRAVNRYNQSIGSLESRVLRQARRFPELGIQTTKELTEVKPVEVTPRSLRERTALASGDNGIEVQDSAKFINDDSDGVND